MSCNCRRSSSGSSESASICSRVSTLPNVMSRSEAAACLSRSTVTDESTRSICSTTTCLLSPLRMRTSGSVRVWKPENSALTA
jgi:hypothetical protein